MAKTLFILSDTEVVHFECGEQEHTFHQPIWDGAYHEAMYDSLELAKEVIRTYIEGDPVEYAESTWEIKECKMKWVEYLTLPEFDGF